MLNGNIYENFHDINSYKFETKNKKSRRSCKLEDMKSFIFKEMKAFLFNFKFYIKKALKNHVWMQNDNGYLYDD